MTVAALYVDPLGPYMGLPGVDPWTEERDARLYEGPYPVVAHPPCARWGRYWFGGPTAHKHGKRQELGDDGGCFAAALEDVRQWGGVLEHPEASHAWKWFGINAPPRSGGWVTAGIWDGGWTCCVEQGHYGHKARKATWLYVFGLDDLPDLAWGKSAAQGRIDHGFHTTAERRAWVAAGRPGKIKHEVSAQQRRRTPEAFRDLLLEMARNVAA